ncbi:MAG: hypothetical protein NVSMB45_02150 [Ginsengibacter sp.]
MKKLSLFIAAVILLASCSLLRKKDKYGCPTNGRNVGAEKLLSGDKAAMKAEKKAKFRGIKSY